MVEKFPFFHYFFTAFAKQWSLIDSGGLLLTLSPLITEKSLSDFDFSIVAIKNIISKLDPNEANSDNMISIYMLIKACVLYYFCFLPKGSISKIIKMLFNYSNHCIFAPFFPYFPDSKGHMKLE